ncbi:sensor histidine kinase [Azospirillum sp. sgz301742]
MRLLHSTTFRVALLYQGLFLTSVLVILGLIHTMSTRFLDRQTDQPIELELNDFTAVQRAHGLSGLVAAVQERSRDSRTGTLYRLTGPDGQVLAGSLAPPAAPDADPTRPMRALGRAFEDGSHLLIGRDVTERRDFERQLREVLVLALLLTVAFAVLGGVLISRNVTHRLEVINRTTRRIMVGHLDERIPRFRNDDELDQLAGNLNEMLDQIGHLMAGLRHVSEGIAHDLRTPLNRLRAQLEMAAFDAQELDGGDAIQDAIQEAIQEADRLLDMFAALLSIAKAEAGYQQIPLSEMELGAVVRRVAEFYEPVAEERSVTLRVDADREVMIVGQDQLLAQAVANLIDNAIKYTPPGGSVSVTVTPTPEIVVADTGPGIAPEDRERVVRRFFRLEHSRTTPGNGLGLALVDAVARLHDAALEMADNGPGLRVTLRFRNAGRPAAPRPHPHRSGLALPADNGDKGGSTDRRQETC